MNIKRYLSDVVLGILGLVIMNAVMQFGVVKYMEANTPTAEAETFLFFTGMIGFLGGSLGGGNNYSRMAASTRRKTENGDYNWFLLMCAGIILVIVLVACFLKQIHGGFQIFGIYLVVFISVVRFYGDVEYRLNVNYKRFFCYYVLIAIGYLVGVCLYPITHSWIWILLLGEGAALGYVSVTGSIFKGNFWRRSEDFKMNFKESCSLSIAYMLSDFPSYSDRLLLPFLGKEGDVLQYYVATLIGKIITLLTTPLNGVLIGHLAQFKGDLKRKHFALIVAVVSGLGFIVSMGALVMTHVFVYIMYREMYDAVKYLFLIAVVSQVLFFFSNTMMVIILRFADEKYQMYIGIIYVVLFVLIVIPLLAMHGLKGFAWGILLANLAKYLVIIGVGFFSIGSKKGVESK
ncbi:MAG: lipopolysaccharide biosynthesis protein [Lachnospiraceae bacterium]